MLNLYDMIQDFKKEGIKIYEAELPSDVIKNGIGFFDIEDFIEYLKDNNVTTVFGTEYFAEERDYLISDELIEKECDFFDYVNCVTLQSQIKEYNNSIRNMNFNFAVAILLACIVEGAYIFVYISDDNNLIEATKYCSHHFPTEYPIYDSYVEKVLLQFKRQDRFYQFKKDDLKDYPKFKKILMAFKQYYDIDEYNLKDIDRYLWQLGKEYYLRKY